MTKKILFALIFFLSITQAAFSINILSFDYSGLITNSSIPDISIGDAFSGSFSYDLDTIDDGILSFNSGLLDFTLSSINFQIEDNNVGIDYFNIFAFYPNIDEAQWLYRLCFYGPESTFSTPSIEQSLDMVLNGQFQNAFIERHSFTLGTDFIGEIRDLTKNDNNMVPEPMTIFMFIISLLGVFGFRKRVI